MEEDTVGEAFLFSDYPTMNEEAVAALD